MASDEAKQSAKENDEQAPVHVIVDQDGLFLRVEHKGEELEAGVDYELYEEELDPEEQAAAKEALEDEVETEPTKPEVKAPSPVLTTGAAPLANDPNACPDCHGTGLKSETQTCPTCEGSGKVG